MNNNRVLLIFPSLGKSRETPNRPPLGLLTVAAPLAESGMEVTLLDERVESDFDNKLSQELRKNPLCVGISSMSGHHIRYALRISKLVKEKSKISVVWGGVQASLEPRSTIEHELIDIVVRDDGEETFPKLLECLDGKTSDLDQVDGIAFKKNGNIIFTNPSKPADIEKLPPLPFHLIDFTKYKAGARDYWASSPKHIIPIETSRGCPFMCSFCTESVRKKKWRALPPERVVEDIKFYIRKYGIRNFTFIDDNLFGDIRRGEKLVELLVREQLGINWYTNIRPDFMSRVDESFIKMLEKAGCRMLTFGAESGSERILKMVNKRSGTEEVIRTNRKLVGLNIAPHFVTIRGFPTETKEDIKLTYLLNIQLLLENRKAICDSPFLIPTPGTKIVEMCLGEQIKNYTLEDWAKIFDFGKDKRPPWVSEEVYDFINKHRAFVSIIARANSSTKIGNIVYRFILRAYRLGFEYGFSEYLDRLLSILKNLIIKYIL